MGTTESRGHVSDMTTSNMVTRRLAMGNGAGTVCCGRGGGCTGLTAVGLEGPGSSPAGLPEGGALSPGGLWRGRLGWKEGWCPWGLPGRGLLRHPPGSSLLSSTSPLFVPLPLGCQIWLTQSVVSLLRLAPRPKPSALHHHSSPCAGRGEGGWRRAGGGGQGTSGQPSTFSPVFPLTLPASVPEAGAGAPRSSLVGPGAGTRALIPGSSQG